MSDGAQSFGERMRDLRRARGEKLGGPGRRPIAEKFKTQIAATERTFANALPVLAQEFVDELRTQDPERCPEHNRVLRCPETGCGSPSQRSTFNHKAAGYVLDRIMGRPTSRSESALQVQFVQQITTTMGAIFREVNGLATPEERQIRMAELLVELAAPHYADTRADTRSTHDGRARTPATGTGV